MCGRFTLTAEMNTLQETFPWLNIPAGAEIPPRYNVAPTQPVAVVANDGKQRLDFFVWGLIPGWAKDPGIGSRMINARAETLAEKPSFRNAYRRRRCLILADGFYEWQSIPGARTAAGKPRKQPVFIHMEKQRPFAFAGLWERWHNGDGSEILSCTIITTEPNELLQPIHNRMPVILSPSAYTQWLSPEELPASQLQPLLKPYPPAEMKYHPVSTLVNNPANDSPACLQPDRG